MEIILAAAQKFKLFCPNLGTNISNLLFKVRAVWTDPSSKKHSLTFVSLHKCQSFFESGLLDLNVSLNENRYFLFCSSSSVSVEVSATLA